MNISKKIKEAVKVLKEGGIIIYPTESSYAIGADATNENAIKKVYEIKRRPLEKKLNVIVDSIEMAEKYAYISELEKVFLILVYPKTLTLLARKKENLIPDILNHEFAFRIPSNLLALELVKQFGKPITATSANISGKEPIYEIDKIYRTFDDKVNYVLDFGDLPKKPVSSIVRLYNGKLEVIRESSISKKELEKIYELALELTNSILKQGY